MSYNNNYSYNQNKKMLSPSLAKITLIKKKILSWNWEILRNYLFYFSLSLSFFFLSHFLSQGFRTNNIHPTSIKNAIYLPLYHRNFIFFNIFPKIWKSQVYNNHPRYYSLCFPSFKCVCAWKKQKKTPCLWTTLLLSLMSM